MIDPGPSDDGKKSKKGSQPPRPDYEVWEKNAKGVTEHLKCHVCNKIPEPRRISRLCKCTSLPWATRNALPWQERNIDLRCEDDARGVGAFARSKFEDQEILGEYQGELTPPNGSDSRYIFGIDNHAETTLVHIDSNRIGNWTRFINHSRDPNAGFEVVRVGTEVRVIIRTSNVIEKDEEITVNYGVSIGGNSIPKGYGVGVARLDVSSVRKRKSRRRMGLQRFQKKS